MPKEHGIPFCPEMIRVLLEHRKSMTRRTKGLEEINENPDAWRLSVWPDGVMFIYKETGKQKIIKCPYAVGDLWYAKGEWATIKAYDSLKPSELPRNAPIFYKAENPQWDNLGRWRSAMFLPKRFARIRGTITAVGCERVQDISRDDCLAEGIVGTREWCELDFKAPEPLHPEDKSLEEADKEIERGWGAYTRQSFAALWDNLNGKTHPWASNPWVWKLTISEETP